MPASEVMLPESILEMSPAGAGRPCADLVQQNVIDWKNALRGQFANRSLLGQVSVFAPDRAPSSRTVRGGAMSRP
eukprot:11083442-Alexandrium_andersonii.AAC.1